MSILLDNPLVASVMFYPRRAQMGEGDTPNVYDGLMPTSDGVQLGYRLFAHSIAKALILFFHGNGEIASDYDGIVPLFFEAGAALMVVDYRGYGWSTGQPQGSKLLPDAEVVVDGLADVIERSTPTLKSLPWIVMGRSLGSAPAIHAAHTRHERFKGLIVESGFASGRDWLAGKAGLKAILSGLPDPLPNTAKVAEVPLPLLVIHGEQDSLIPVEHGQRLYDASRSIQKTLLRVRGAGHNDLMMVGMREYFSAVKTFIQQIIS